MQRTTTDSIGSARQASYLACYDSPWVSLLKRFSMKYSCRYVWDVRLLWEFIQNGGVGGIWHHKEMRLLCRNIRFEWTGGNWEHKKLRKGFCEHEKAFNFEMERGKTLAFGIFLAWAIRLSSNFSSSDADGCWVEGNVLQSWIGADIRRGCRGMITRWDEKLFSSDTRHKRGEKRMSWHRFQESLEPLKLKTRMRFDNSRQTRSSIGKMRAQLDFHDVMAEAFLELGAGIQLC